MGIKYNHKLLFAWLTSVALFATVMLTLALASSCRSHKQVQNDITVSADSLAVAHSHRSFFSLDSVFARLCFDFDTLEYEIGNPYALGYQPLTDTPRFSELGTQTHDTITRYLATMPLTTRLRVVNGHVSNDRGSLSRSLVASSKSDSTATSAATSDKSSLQQQVVRVYDPPDMTFVTIAISLILALAILCYFLYHRRK